MDLGTAIKLYCIPFTRIKYVYSNPFKWTRKHSGGQIFEVKKKLLGFKVVAVYTACCLLRATHHAWSAAQNNEPPLDIFVDIFYSLLYATVLVLYTYTYVNRQIATDIIRQAIVLEKYWKDQTGMPLLNHWWLGYLALFFFIATPLFGIMASLAYLHFSEQSRYLVNLFGVVKSPWLKYPWSLVEGYMVGSNMYFGMFTVSLIIIACTFINSWFNIICINLTQDVKIPAKKTEELIHLYQCTKILIGYLDHFISPILSCILGILFLLTIVSLMGCVKFFKVQYYKFYGAFPIYFLVSVAVELTFFKLFGYLYDKSEDFIKNGLEITINKNKHKTDKTQKLLETKFRSLNPIFLNAGSFFRLKKSTYFSFLTILTEETVNAFLTYNFEV